MSAQVVDQKVQQLKERRAGLLASGMVEFNPEKLVLVA
jgi:hypothetical protein